MNKGSLATVCILLDQKKGTDFLFRLTFRELHEVGNLFGKEYLNQTLASVSVGHLIFTDLALHT